MIYELYVQIQDFLDNLPFDIAGIRTLRVDYRFVDSMSRCKEEIVKQIEYIEGNPSKTVSPVSFALDYISATRDGNPESKAIMNMSTQIELLSSKLAELESRLPGIKFQHSGANRSLSKS